MPSTWIKHRPLIAILRGVRPDEVLAHIEVLLEEGLDAMEIPLNSPDWEQSVQLAARQFGAKALIGAGTVLQTHDVEQLAACQGRLVVTPNTNPDVIRASVAHDMVTCIGCLTATEAFAAAAAGAQALKIFPSSGLGPSYIRALRAVLPRALPVFAVGGITPDNLADYLAAGCIGAGLGSDLYRPGQPPSDTRQRARAFTQAYLAATVRHRSPA